MIEDRDWWEASDTDWTRGEPGRVRELLAVAYPSHNDIGALAVAAGLDGDVPIAGAGAFQQWTSILTSAARLNKTLDLVAEALRDPASSAFHATLEMLLGDRLGLVNARIALRYGPPPNPTTEQRDPFVDSIRKLSSGPTDEPLGALQAVTSFSAGLPDVRAFLQGLNDALSRTAMIEVGGRPRGTGFLVGDDLLLTAAHVLDAVQLPPPSASDTAARFDFVATAGRSEAETGVLVPVVEFLEGSLPTAGEVAGTALLWDAPADQLDFALLRLEYPPAVGAATSGGHAMRGGYALDRTPYDFAASPLLFIIQHPLGQTQKITWIGQAAEVNGSKTRIRYRGNTLNGSSGSPVIDARGRLVALHHYSQTGVNQGVPSSAIAACLLDGPHGALFRGAPPIANVVQPVASGCNPFATIVLGGRPFVNRSNLRDGIRGMVDETAGRTLAITGESGSGVSYSYVLTSHIAQQSKLSQELRQLAPGGITTVKIDLRDYIDIGLDERRSRITGDLLVALGLRRPDEPLAQDARNVSTVVQWLKTCFRKDARQWWVFVDSVDSVVSTKQGGVDELITGLIRIANEDFEAQLRVVLGGREAEQFAMDYADWFIPDSATGLARADVQTWLESRAAEQGRAIDGNRLAAKLDELFPSGAILPEPRRLAPKLPQALIDLLEAANGN